MSLENARKAHRKPKKRRNKINLVFDENKRREFLTGFHKRKVQRKKHAQEKFEKELKEERKRIKAEAKESYKKLVVSHRPIPELEDLASEQYEEDDVTVKVVELSASDIAKKSNWIGVNQPQYEKPEETDKEESDEEEVPGMALKEVPSKKIKEKVDRIQFETEKDVKKVLKKQATKTVKKSKVFQMKNRLERQKQKKRSLEMKKQKEKFNSRREKKKGGKGRRQRAQNE